MIEEKDRRKKNQREKKKRAGRIERRDKKDLKIYSPGGKLIYVAKEGFCFDYGELLRRGKRKSENKQNKGSFR